MLDAMPAMSTKTPPWVDRALRALFPPCCVFCGAPVVARHACCAACTSAIHVLPRHGCARCGLPMPAELAPGPCGSCLRRPPPQAQTISLYAYDGPVREAILNWKLEGRDAGLLWLLDAAARRLRETFAATDLLLPVPMPIQRMRRAGQHHAADLCRHIARIVHCRVNWRLLRRIGEQPRQSTLTGSERRRNLARAFRLDEEQVRNLPPDGRLWLVDDILPTGATVRYACRCLKQAGRTVHAFTLARVVR